MVRDLISATVAALEDRDEERLRADIGLQPRKLILECLKYAATGAADIGESHEPDLTEAQAAALKSALMSYILRSRGPYLETALSCLAAYRDPGLKGFMRDQLRKCLTDPERFAGALSQCMNALNELGEPVTAGAEIDPDDIDANIELAEYYLMQG